MFVDLFQLPNNYGNTFSICYSWISMKIICILIGHQSFLLRQKFEISIQIIPSKIRLFGCTSAKSLFIWELAEWILLLQLRWLLFFTSKDHFLSELFKTVFVHFCRSRRKKVSYYTIVGCKRYSKKLFLVWSQLPYTTHCEKRYVWQFE